MDVFLPAELFAKHVEAEKKAGNKIVSNKRKKNGSHVIIFQDGGKIMRHKSGHMIHKYADGKKTQCSPDGKRITVSRQYAICVCKYTIDTSLIRFMLQCDRE